MHEKCNDKYEYPVYSSQTLNDGLMGYYDDFLFENAITWTTDGANAGVVKYRNGKFYCTNVCGVLISEKGYANLCVAYLLNLVSKKYVSYVGNPKLMNNVMAIIKVRVPSIERQNEISEALATIENVILLHHKKLDQLKLQQKSLMQLLLTGIVRV